MPRFEFKVTLFWENRVPPFKVIEPAVATLGWPPRLESLAIVKLPPLMMVPPE